MAPASGTPAMRVGRRNSWTTRQQLYAEPHPPAIPPSSPIAQRALGGCQRGRKISGPEELVRPIRDRNKGVLWNRDDRRPNLDAMIKVHDVLIIHPDATIGSGHADGSAHARAGAVDCDFGEVQGYCRGAHRVARVAAGDSSCELQ